MHCLYYMYMVEELHLRWEVLRGPVTQINPLMASTPLLIGKLADVVCLLNAIVDRRWLQPA